MMISPKSYYEEYLKGKTKEEIEKQIRSIKRDIGHLTRVVESSEDMAPEWEYMPGPDTRLAIDYEYLDYAIQALVEAGETYKPSIKEGYLKTFNDNLNHLKSFDLMTSTDGQEFIFYNVGLINGDALFSYINSNDIDYECVQQKKAELLCTAGEFLETLKTLRIGTWKKRTIIKGREDGWKIKIEFDNGIKTQTLFGLGYYPWSYRELVSYFEEAKGDTD